MKILFSVSCMIILTTAAHAKGFGNTTDQEWGLVEVREGAHIFWWLHYTTATTNATEKPLIIWLAGGPGTSASYFSNFEEIGPLDENLNPRNTSWVHNANILFVDNPVGTGFSYVESDDLYATTNAQIAEDFVNVLRGFYTDVPAFVDVPVYIFSESYGAKMAVEIALNIHLAVENNTLKSNLKGVGLGAGWISPLDSILLYPLYFYQLGYLDTQEFNQLTEEANNVKNFTDAGNWIGAFTATANLSANIDLLTGGVNVYNVLETEQYNIDTTSAQQTLMNDVKTSLNLTSDWSGFFSASVYRALVVDSNKPVTDIVERLLNETDISVAVYNGQLDSDANILGTINWINNIQFNGSENWTSSSKEPFTVNEVIEGYKKKGGNLTFYTVLRSGHLLPKDNPQAVQYILEEVTDNFKV